MRESDEARKKQAKATLKSLKDEGNAFVAAGSHEQARSSYKKALGRWKDIRQSRLTRYPITRL